MTGKKLGCILLTLLFSLALAGCSGETNAVIRGNDIPLARTPDASPATGITLTPAGNNAEQSPAPSITVNPSVSPAPATPADSPAVGPMTLAQALVSGKPTLAEFGSTT